MAPTTGLNRGKYPPGTPQILDQLQRFGDKYLVSPFQNILHNTPPSEQITITSPTMSLTLLNVVMLETVTETLDNHKEVVSAVNNLSLTSVSSTQPGTDIQEDNLNVMPPIPDPSLLPSPPSRIFPSATITTNFVSK